MYRINCIELILIFVMLGFLLKACYERGRENFKHDILKKNPDYYLTKDLKIEKVWCIPD